MTKEELRAQVVDEFRALSPEAVLDELAKLRGIHPELDMFVNHVQTWVTADLTKSEIKTVSRYWPEDLQALWATTEKVPEDLKVKAFFWAIQATAKTALSMVQSQSQS